MKAMKNYYAVMLSVILGTTLLLLGGCVLGTSAPTKFYVLNALVGFEHQKQNETGQNCPSIGIGPLHFPAYLDRPQIVTRISPNELSYAEFDHWAEPLQNDVVRVLAENISRLICTKAIAIYPWKRSSHIDYQVDIEIVRMDGKLGGNVVLLTQWAIINPFNNSILLTKKSQYNAAATGTGFSEFVAAHSRLIGALSHDIAETIGSLHHQRIHS